MSTFSDVGWTPVVDTPRSAQPDYEHPPRDLHEAMERLDVADALLLQGQVTAGRSLLVATKASMRSLLGDPEPSFSLPPIPSTERVLSVSPRELKTRINGLVARGVPLYVAVNHGDTDEPLSRLRVDVSA